VLVPVFAEVAVLAKILCVVPLILVFCLRDSLFLAYWIGKTICDHHGHVCSRNCRLRWRIRTRNIRQNEDQDAKKSYKGHKIRRFIFESQTVLRIYLSRFCEQYLSFYDDKT